MDSWFLFWRLGILVWFFFIPTDCDSEQQKLFLDPGSLAFLRACFGNVERNKSRPSTDQPRDYLEEFCFFAYKSSVLAREVTHKLKSKNSSIQKKPQQRNLQ
jgi:hypothetical protein